jgi:hypothetical protein
MWVNLAQFWRQNLEGQELARTAPGSDEGGDAGVR